ncbi:MAG: redox-sensing transcriptional repressor Rex [Planctomycetota bacterium]|jgi:redox-sensing transcriptional repressor
MRYRKIPDETIRRLPIYLRTVLVLISQGHKNASSKQLADLLGINHWQIRKDFSYFGDFGTPGVGYKLEKLKKQIKKIIKLDSTHKTALVGVGNLGSAVLEYPGFKEYSFNIVTAFDVDPKKVGRKIGNIVVEDIKKLNSLAKRNIQTAIITVPGNAAQETADALVKAGVKGILNFSPKHISVPKKVKVISIDIAMDLARLPYYMPAN